MRRTESITDELLSQGNQLTTLIQQFGKQIILPTIRVPSYLKRSETMGSDLVGIASKLGTEAQLFQNGWGLNTRFDQDTEGLQVALTYAASPHTRVSIQNDDAEEIPAHLAVFFWKQQDGAIAPIEIEMNPDTSHAQQMSCYKRVAEATRAGVQFLQDRLSIPNEDLSRNIRMFYLTGHLSQEERQQTGLSRGAKSNPFTHINLCFHPPEGYKHHITPTVATARQFLKHTGLIDTIVMNKWGNAFANLTMKILQPLMQESFIVTKQALHTVTPNLSRFSVNENIDVRIPEGIPLEYALYYQAALLTRFNRIHEVLFSLHTNWYQAEQQGITVNDRKQLIQHAIPMIEELGLDSTTARELADFALSFHPTRGQLAQWGNSVTRYEKIEPYVSSHRRYLTNFLARMYGVDPFTAEMLVEMIADMTKDSEKEWRNIQYTWSSKFSASILMRNYRIINNRIFVTRFSISPRFSTDKGMLEDDQGVMPERDAGV